MAAKEAKARLKINELLKEAGWRFFVNEIAKPLRRYDSPLYYVPTQYITDFIKSIKIYDQNEYNEIEYRSTMCKDGYNLAVFDEKLLECVSATVFDIEELKYDYREVE